MAGIVGAFLGSLLSAVCIILTGQLGYMASICGLAMLYFFALLGAVPMTLAGLRANSAADLFRMDADCAQVEDGYYMTQAGDVLYGVMIQTDCSEKDALDVLLAPIGDYRMVPDFDRCAFAFPGEQENLLTMTEEDGAAYRYNILSIYFTDGAVLHTAVALAEDGTLIRLESTHGPQVDDQEVLGHMLYILRHMEREDKGSVPDGTAALWSTSHNDGPRKEPACSRSCRLHRHWELWALMGAASSIDRGGETNVLAMDRAGPVRPV